MSTDSQNDGPSPGDAGGQALIKALAAAGAFALLLAIVMYVLRGRDLQMGLPEPGGGLFNNYLNQAPPELDSTGTWINSDGPVTLAAQQGKVVWLEFSFLH